MKKATEQPLVKATRRLIEAIERLERDVQGLMVEEDRQEHNHAQLSMFAKQNANLQSERDQLAEAIEGLRSEHGSLQQVAHKISNKLNDSIKRLDQIIEG